MENKELRGSNIDYIYVPWWLSFFIIPILTVLTSMGILIYQIYGYVAYDDWRELSIIDSIVFSFGGTTFVRLLDNYTINLVRGFLSAWIGVIILGALFLLIHILI